MSQQTTPWWQKVIRHPVFQYFASLKLAVFVLLSLSFVLGVATVLESYYGTRAVYLLVYGTWWFYGLLAFLSANVLCAALSRFPWKKRQVGFLVTHTGILMILFGSYLTMQFGVDGSLPVVEGNEDREVILDGLYLKVVDDETGVKREFPVPENALRQVGQVMEVDLGKGTRIEVDEYLPRMEMQTRYRESPVPGVGAPAVHVEIFNSRFQLDEWLVLEHPEAPQDYNLGPAILSFQRLWNDKDLKKFVNYSPEISSKDMGIGFLHVDFQGKTIRLKIEDALKGWIPLAGSDLEARVEKYLPYAVVEGNELVSRSDKPINPAVQLRVRDGKGNEERHSVFAVFPEFTTMHRKQKKGERQFNLRIRMISLPIEQQKAKQSGRGRLMLAQTPDRKTLKYRIFGREGDLKTQGDVVVGEEIVTGWMDLKFKVSQYIPVAVKAEEPHYIESIEGQSANFLSAIHLRVVQDRSVAKESLPGIWLSEGETRVINAGGHPLRLELSKRSMNLPFTLFLEKFHIGTNPGTEKAASYESNVRVHDPKLNEKPKSLISMNEPMVHGGYTFYQASYQLREGRPPVSVFSVNFDPGRWMKYLGSIVMCLGICVMFYFNPHYWDIILGRKQ